LLRRAITLRLQFLVALAAFLAIALPVMPVSGQTGTTGTTRITIDGPADGVTVRNGTPVLIGGWAVDTAGPGTGVDMVQIYLNGTMDGGGTLLGTANYGDARPDVAAALGSPAYTNSGFNYSWTPAALNGGTHTLYIYAQSLTSGWVQQALTVHVPAQQTSATPGPAPAAAGTPVTQQGTYWSGYPPPGTAGQAGPYPQGNLPGGPGVQYYPNDLMGPRPGYPGGPGYPGYPGGPGYPAYPGAPGYPGYPGILPGGGNGICPMIYPPPPGC
jgi:hypothetical protein